MFRVADLNVTSVMQRVKNIDFGYAQHAHVERRALRSGSAGGSQQADATAYPQRPSTVVVQVESCAAAMKVVRQVDLQASAAWQGRWSKAVT